MDQVPGHLQIVYMDDLIKKISVDDIVKMGKGVQGNTPDGKRMVASTRYILRDNDMLSAERDEILGCCDISQALGIRTMILNARMKSRKDIKSVIWAVDEIAKNVMAGYSVLLRFHEMGDPERDFPKYMEALRPLKAHKNLELCAHTDWLSRINQETLQGIITDDGNLSIGIVLGDRSALPEKYHDLVKRTSAVA